MGRRGKCRWASSDAPAKTVALEDIVSLCKRRGFVSEGSALYGGFAHTFDYGPLGVQLKRNLEAKWWNDFVKRRLDCVGLETPIVMNPDVWRASGHTEEFTDPLVECRKCHKRVRADHLLEAVAPDLDISKMGTLESIGLELEARKPLLPTCKKKECTFGAPRQFNLLFRTHVGSSFEDSDFQVWDTDESMAFFGR